MVLAPTTEIIPLTADAHGVLRIGNTRVTLDTVLAAFADGATAEEIVQQYPSLHLADVYSVIGYYLRHTADVDAYLHQRRAQREAIRQQSETRFDPQGGNQGRTGIKLGGCCRFVEKEKVSGTTAERPLLEDEDVGYQYFDTTLGMPI